MIKFFRRIRQRLLTENPPSGRAGKFSPPERRSRVGKYLLYAVGEIVLVVIGILIALSINNWNEQRKDRIQEKIVLSDLAKNIEINIQTFEKDIESLQQWNRSSEIVIRVLENKLAFSDTLKQHFHLARITKQNLFLSNVGYQAYKDQGLGIITNKALSSEIINLYEVTVPGILATNGLVNELEATWDNHIVQNFDFVQGEGLTPNDYESLFSDHFYISWIKAYNQGRRSLVLTDQTLIKECEKVLKMINDELR